MARNIEKILLVPTDFSETCQNATEYAVGLAEHIKYKVLILHVINKEPRSKQTEDEIELEVNNTLKKIVSSLKKKSKVDIEYLARHGSIFATINEVAEETHASLMILGTHGKKGFQYLFGSYAMRVISESPVPVVTVHRKKFLKESLKRAVFPIGIYTEARQQVQHAIATSRLFGSEILILRQKGNIPEDDKRLDIITEQIIKEFDKNKVKYALQISASSKNFASQVISYAVEKNAGFILMMTDGNLINPDFNVSSWSEKIMFNEAQIPVLCINPVYLGQIYFPF